jgi:hypothetical protein
VINEILVVSMYSYCMFVYLYRAIWHSSATLTEGFPCFFVSCKANARVKPAKTGHGPHSFKKICVGLCIVCFVSFCVLFVCTELLPPGGYPIAVNKYIISYLYIYIYISVSVTLNPYPLLVPRSKNRVELYLYSP